MRHENFGHQNKFLFLIRHEIYNLTLGNVRVTAIEVQKQYFLYIMCVCVCIVAFVIRHAQRMRRIILPSVPGLALSFFATLSHKRNDFRKTFNKSKIYFDFLYKYVLNISHSEKNLSRYFHTCI